MTPSSRALAKIWPYQRYATYERELRRAAASWFAKHNLPISARYDFILDQHSNWLRNLILTEVAEFIANEQAAREQARLSRSGLSEWQNSRFMILCVT